MTTLRILATRHSAFYTPLLATIAAGFLGRERVEGAYGTLPKGRSLHEVLRAGEAHIVLSAVSSTWDAMERGGHDLAVHFAQINRRDGFFLAGRKARTFEWKGLEGTTLLADHGRQPLAMIRYAAHVQGIDWGRIKVVDAGSPEEIDAAFRAGRGDYAHLQGPWPQRLESEGAGHVVASVGEAMAPNAFSSLACSRAFPETELARAFTRAYAAACRWVVETPAAEIARRLAAMFPGLAPEVLAATIARYQKVGCWHTDISIPRDLYEQSLNVFEHAGVITRRHAYDDVVVPPPLG